MNDPVLRRVVRRETHSPRTVAAVVAVLVVIAALVWAGVELVLFLAGRPPFLVAPGAATEWLGMLPTAAPAALVAGGAAIALVGLVFAGLAILPGRLSKHPLVSPDRAIIVDNGVLASSLARAVADGLDLDRDGVRVGVGHRVVDVVVRPDGADTVTGGEVKRVVEDELAAYDLTARMSIRVRVETPKEVRVR